MALRAICDPLQGFVNAIVFVFLTRRVRTQLFNFLCGRENVEVGQYTMFNDASSPPLGIAERRLSSSIDSSITRLNYSFI
eukprot:NODE_6235_length_522_cov_45.813953_g5468_i0.p2 GENE.NODE_6235_length_522_cov_45.813953_g5468_i0~~NODE_6235_length_522_cov_45.813953_g5468_i0.p2  ORF type:complete len:80 (-),score=8.35 NODE_6235_length_522_cov_45.813953_g5468_i0:79-318(-)